MTSEPVVGVVFGRLVEGKTTLSYICLPFHSPTQASQLTGILSYYRFRCHYPLINYLITDHLCSKQGNLGQKSAVSNQEPVIMVRGRYIFKGHIVCMYNAMEKPQLLQALERKKMMSSEQI